jgi:NADP-dependent 3-hydroxy acid dehydrogenase YdfG
MSVWFVTGASRGFGAEIAREALSRGHQVVATARRKDAVEAAFSDASSSLLAVSLDVTDEAQAAVAVKAAVKRFGRIDVLVTVTGLDGPGRTDISGPTS